MSKQTGRVKWFSVDKGYGFILNEQDEDVFVHYRSINPEREGFKILQENQAVTFTQVKSDKGWQAAEVITHDDQGNT